MRTTTGGTSPLPGAEMELTGVELAGEELTEMEFDGKDRCEELDAATEAAAVTGDKKSASRKNRTKSIPGRQ